MHIVSTLAVGLSVLAFAAATGTVQLEFKRDEELARRGVRKRQSTSAGTGSTDLQLFQQLLYFIEVAIGTPPQPVKLQLDTGSSDIFALAPSVTGLTGGSFDHTQSSTFDDISPGSFSAGFVDGTNVTGDYFTDQFTVAGLTVSNQQMGVGLIANGINAGIMGVGYQGDEASGGNQYLTSIENMVSQNLIPSQAYSIWLNDLEAASGSILFGGIDTSKYSGNLASIAIYPEQDFEGIIKSFNVQLTSLSVTTPSGTTNIQFAPIGAVLDSGTSRSTLPDAIVAQLYSVTGAVWNEEFSSAAVLCSARSIPGNFTFGFAGPNGPSISVPIAQLIIPAVINGITLNSSLTPMEFPHASPSDTLCIVDVNPASSFGGSVLLGDAFLRSAYVVFDLDNNRIGMANTVFNSTAPSNVVPFASSGAPMPSASTVSEPSLTYAATATAAASTSTSFKQTAPTWFQGSAGLAFASAVVKGEAGSVTATFPGLVTATGVTATGAAGHKSAAMGVRPLGWSGFIVVEVLAGLFMMGVAVVLM